MRRVYLDNNMTLIGVKNFKGNGMSVDYYLVTKDNERLYAFTNIYTRNSYNLCKSGIRVNDLVGKRTRDTGVMRLVKLTNRMLPYLSELYELPLAA